MRRLKLSAGLLLITALVAAGANVAGAQEGEKEKDPEQRSSKPRQDKPRKEELKLRCESRTLEGAPVIGCRWTKSERREFASYVLIRKAGEEDRKPVFRTDDRSHTRYADKAVATGTSYVYAVEARNRGGHVISHSRPVRVECCNAEGATTTTTEKREPKPEPKPQPKPEPRPEPKPQPDGQMRFACQGMTKEDKQAVACKWSPSEAEGFTGYKLYRETEGSGTPRAVIFQTNERGRNGYLDTTAEQGKTYSYTVETLGAEGVVIGRGGPQKVTCCTADPPPDRPQKRAAETSERRASRTDGEDNDAAAR